MKTREYQFPNAVIVIQDRKCTEIPKWCSLISVERDRHYVAGALLQLRQYNRALRGSK